MDYRAIQVGGHRRNSRQGIALVDEADVEAVSKYRWSIHIKGYAFRNVKGNKLVILMHRELLGLIPGDGLQADHIDGNKLNNRRENLRICTNAQNHQNLHHLPYRGAYSRNKRWVAEVQLDKKSHYLGRFDTQEEAAAVAAAFRREHMPFSSDAREVNINMRTIPLGN